MKHVVKLCLIKFDQEPFILDCLSVDWNDLIK